MLNWFSLIWVRIAGVALLVASIAGWGAYEMHKHDVKKYNDLQKQFTTFKITTAALGEAAKKAAALQALHDVQKQERADDENKRTHTADVNTIVRLRKQLDSARGSFVPAARAGAARPDLACFDRAALESAIGKFVGDVRGFADEGTAATIDLNTAKAWAQER